MRNKEAVVLLLCIISTTKSNKVERNALALPKEIFREHVEPKRGGKVPEAARNPERIELNKKDAAGLQEENDVQQNEIFDTAGFGSDFFQSPFDDVSDDDYSNFPYNPVFDPVKISGSAGENYAVAKPEYTNPYEVMYDSLFKKPQKPIKNKEDTYKYIDIDPPKNSYQEPYQPYDAPPSYNSPYSDYPSYEPPSYNDYSPGYDYSPPSNDYYSPPVDNYAPAKPTYETPVKPTYEAPYEPEPYYPPKPVGPVLLEKRPYEVKSVQPLPITVSEPYTSFDCRSKHPGRHYADPEANCQVYHFCHHDGKQDTFNCGYGTYFNEYIGTCDYKSNVHCTAGEGYIPKPHHQSEYHPEPYHQPDQYQYQQEQYQPPPPPPYKDQFNEPPSDFFSSGNLNSANIKPFTNFGPF